MKINIDDIIRRVPFSSSIYKICESFIYEDVDKQQHLIKTRGFDSVIVVLDTKERECYSKLFKNKDFNYINNKIEKDFYGKKLIVKEGFLNKK